LLLDVAEIGLDRKRDRTFSEGDDWACLVRYEYDEPAARLHRHITSFCRADTLYRRAEEHHIVQLYDADQVAGWVKSVGFQVQQVRSFGEGQLLPLRAGLIARRPLK